MSKRFNSSRWVLEDISLELEEGDRLGIVGVNGAGKSTLLSIIAGLADATRGSVDVDGDVSAIFSLGVGLRDDLTGRKSIFVEGEARGLSGREISSRVDEIVDFAELGDFIDRPVRTYSTGMKARLAFATIAFLDPEILIVDETLSVGDNHFSRKASRKMRQLAEVGKILLLTSHSMPAICEYANRCIWLDGGRIVMEGEPAVVTRAYLERVRAEEDERSRTAFVAATGVSVGDAIWGIDAIELRDRDGARSDWSVSTGDDLAILVSAHAPAEVVSRMEMAIMRIDGLHVANSSFELGEHRKSKTADLKMKISLGSLVINRGLYAVTIRIVTDTTVMAETSQLLEVRNVVHMSGGSPVYVAVPTVTVERTSP